jgi:hypothetical protein
MGELGAGSVKTLDCFETQFFDLIFYGFGTVATEAGVRT